MTTYSEAKVIRETLQSETQRLSAILHGFPRGATGITPDNIKQSAEFQFAKGLYDQAFTKLRIFNAYMAKNFSREMREERAMAHHDRLDDLLPESRKANVTKSLSATRYAGARK